MRTDRMTSVLSDAEETLHEYLETHCEGYHYESEDWEDTLDEIINFECSDWIHEIADSSVPIYTAELLECAMEDLGLATTEPEIGPAFGGEPTAVNIIAANIYEDICNHLYEVEQKLKRKVVDNHKTKDGKDVNTTK